MSETKKTPDGVVRSGIRVIGPAGDLDTDRRWATALANAKAYREDRALRSRSHESPLPIREAETKKPDQAE